MRSLRSDRRPWRGVVFPYGVGFAVTSAATLGFGCDGVGRRSAAVHAPVASSPRTPSWLERGLEAYAGGDFEQAAFLLEHAHEDSPGDAEVTFALARAWQQSDRSLQAEDLIGDLLLADPAFRSRIQSEPVFQTEAFAQLLASGGLSSLPEVNAPRASFDLDGNGVDEIFAISHRATREERFLGVVSRTAGGVVAKRLVTARLPTPFIAVFRTARNAAVVLLESVEGHSAAAEIHLVQGAPANPVITYSNLFVQDPGDGDDPPPAQGALWFSVIDVIAGGEPELVLTFVDPSGEPGQTWLLDIDGVGVKDLGAAVPLRRDAARRLRAAHPSLTRPIAEALVRLEPENLAARLELLVAADTASRSEWWGFYPPGSNNFVALHGAFFARHSPPQALSALAQVPSVNSFLAKWSLTTEQLGSQSDPLLPATSLWGRAFFLEPVGVSTAFSYFRLVEDASGSAAAR